MKVLFAVNNENISNLIIKKYQQIYKEIISSKNVYYFNAIIKELQKDKTYDRIVISEDLEPFANNNYETIDNFIFEKLDNISDEATTPTGEDIPIILISTDRRNKSDNLLIKLFGIGVYSSLLGQDRSIDEVCKLINKPRSKKEAKIYYNIDSNDVEYRSENEADVSETEIQNILTHYKRLGKNEDRYVESFDSIASQYTDQQLRVIIKFLPLNVRAVLEASSPRYQQLISFGGEKIKTYKAPTYKDTAKNKTKMNNNINNAISNNGIKIESIKNENSSNRPTKPVIIPTDTANKTIKKVENKPRIQNVEKTENKPRVQNIQRIENKPRVQNIEKMDNKPRIQNTEKVEINKKPIEKINIEKNKESNVMQKLENEKINQIDVTSQKRGRGRPRKIVTEELEETTKPQNMGQVKRGRGRPRKNVEPVVENKNRNAQVDELLDLFDVDEENNVNNTNNYYEKDEGILAGFEELNNYEDNTNVSQKYENNSYQDDNNVLSEYEDNSYEDDNSMLPGFEDDSYEDDDSMLPGFEDDSYEDDDSMLPGFEDDSYEEDNGVLPGFESLDEEDNMNYNNTSNKYNNSNYNIDDYNRNNYNDNYDTDNYNSNNNSNVDNYGTDNYNTGNYDVNNYVTNNYDKQEEYSANYEKQNYSASNYNAQYNQRQDIDVYDIKTSEIIENLLTRDKKIVSFVGTSKNGTSFLINNIAEILSNQGIKTAVLDLTKNRNSYYIYTKNEEQLRKIAFSCTNKLAKGIAEGIKVNKNLDVYTSLPVEDEGIDRYEEILTTLVKNYSLVLLDCDFNTHYGYLKQSQEIYLVQSMDVLTIQPLTAYLRDLKAKNVLEQNKLRIVINKFVRVKGVNEKAIIGGMAFYNDPAMSFMTELFNRENIKYTIVPFDMNSYSKYLEGLINCNISINGYSKDMVASLKRLSNMVYPLIANTQNSSKEKYNNPKYNKYASQNTNTPFSNNMNSTLDKMKRNY